MKNRHRDRRPLAVGRVEGREHPLRLILRVAVLILASRNEPSAYLQVSRTRRGTTVSVRGAAR